MDLQTYRWNADDLFGEYYGGRLDERGLGPYGLGIRTAMAAPLSTSPTRVQPADGERQRSSVARSRSEDTRPEGQAFAEDVALTEDRGCSEPAHPKPINSMKSQPARIK